jgi:hypothetical protein
MHTSHRWQLQTLYSRSHGNALQVLLSSYFIVSSLQRLPGRQEPCLSSGDGTVSWRQHIQGDYGSSEEARTHPRRSLLQGSAAVRVRRSDWGHSSLEGLCTDRTSIRAWLRGCGPRRCLIVSQSHLGAPGTALSVVPGDGTVSGVAPLALDRYRWSHQRLTGTTSTI